MKRPICGGAELVHDTRDMPFIYTPNCCSNG
nr:type II toxin-antitoxin system MqsA family antitoxin [Pseudomonas sp. NFACC19-2]